MYVNTISFVKGWRGRKLPSQLIVEYICRLCHGIGNCARLKRETKNKPARRCDNETPVWLGFCARRGSSRAKLSRWCKIHLLTLKSDTRCVYKHQTYELLLTLCRLGFLLWDIFLPLSSNSRNTAGFAVLLLSFFSCPSGAQNERINITCHYYMSHVFIIQKKNPQALFTAHSW